MIFGGIFKKWFGGGQRKHAARLTSLAEAAKNAAATASLNASQGTTPGYLAYDKNEDGVIDPATETRFIDQFEGAATDAEGLMGLDDDGNGVLDSQDAAWYRLGVWDDANKNKKFDAGEFQTLTNLGIASINLSGSGSNGLVSISYSDGRTGTLALSLISAQ